MCQVCFPFSGAISPHQSPGQYSSAPRPPHPKSRSHKACFVLIMKLSEYDNNPVAGLSLMIFVIKSGILLQNVKQNVVLLSVLPCQAPTDTSYSCSSCSPWFPLPWITAFVPPFTNCEAHSGTICAAWRPPALSTTSLSLGPYAFEMSACMIILL